VLDRSVIHLPEKLFSDDENYLDTNFNMFILKNQLNYLVDSKTVKTLFSLVLPANIGGFSEEINPQSVMSLCKIYSVLMMLSQRSPNIMLNEKHLNFTDIISIGLAFNTDLLYTLWKFINCYFDPETYANKNEYNSEQYNAYAHLICIFSQSIIRTLWISSIEDFNKETKFTKTDVINIVMVLKHFVVNTILSERTKFELDRFILRSGSGLIRLLYDMFINELEDDDMEDDLFYIKDILWDHVCEYDQITVSIMELVNSIPECVPFRIRAMIFNNYVSNERHQHKGNRSRVRINRQDIFEDGFQAISQVGDLRGSLMITFVNEYGIEEEGQDAGGIFKEFLVQLSRIIFEPNFGFFTKTEIEEDLYPNPSSSLFEHLPDETILKYYEFFGKILGKAMFDGILIEPQFAKFFLKRLASKSNMISDLKFLDKELFKNLNFLKTYEGDFEDLCLTF
jgi:ubiquitin-protein ligase E3 C